MAAATPTGSTVTAAEQTALLDYSNQVRAEVGVPPLVWDAQIAADAQVWTDHLKAVNEFNHGSWTSVIPGSAADKHEGENLAATSGADDTLVKMATGWYDEKKIWESRRRPTIGSPGWADYGHYVQMVWSTTTRIGCGWSTTPTWAKVLSCRYVLPGNFTGVPPFGPEAAANATGKPPVSPLLTAATGATVPAGTTGTLTTGTASATAPAGASTAAAATTTPTVNAAGSTATCPDANATPPAPNALRCLIDQARRTAGLPALAATTATDQYATLALTAAPFTLDDSACGTGRKLLSHAAGSVGGNTAQEAFDGMGGPANNIVGYRDGTDLDIVYGNGRYGLVVTACSGATGAAAAAPASPAPAPVAGTCADATSSGLAPAAAGASMRCLIDAARRGANLTAYGSNGRADALAVNAAGGGHPEADGPGFCAGSQGPTGSAWGNTSGDTPQAAFDLMGGLRSNIVKNSTATGALGVAVSGTAYGLFLVTCP